MTPALNGLSLEVAPGEAVALVGESGCGKSTAALALLGLLPPSAHAEGRIRLQGTDLLGLPARRLRDLRGRVISMIFQEPMSSLNPVQRVGDQIAESLRCHFRLSTSAAQARAIELLDLVQIAEPQRRVDDFPHQLSGGQRQRVMIAMAVACDPQLLVADEPTTALDVTVQAQILELLDQLRRQLAMGLLFITHDLGVVSQFADRVVVMHGGYALETASARGLFESPAHPYTRGLLATSLHCTGPVHHTERALAEIKVSVRTDSDLRAFDVVVPARKAERATQRERAALTGAAEVAGDARRADDVVSSNHVIPGNSHSAPVESPLLEVRDLTLRYAATRSTRAHAVDGVSLRLARGQTLGLVGESGCGKSTLARALVRLMPVHSGHILFDGQEVGQLSERALRPFRRRVQMVFQDPFGSLNPRHSVGFILESALAAHGEGNRRARSHRAQALLERVGLPPQSVHRYPNEFSGGQRQRIGIARALMAQPELLILDEPVSALDVSIQAQILNLLVELQADLNLAYLFISHDLTVVRYMADQITVMRDGRFVETADASTFWRAPQSDYGRALMAATPKNIYSEPVIPPST